MKACFRISLFFLLFVFNQNTGICRSDLVTCQGFNTPTLSVKVRDALSNEVIETAGVHARYNDAPEDSFTFNKESKVYFSSFSGSDPVLFVEHPGYRSFQNNDLGFILDGTCGGKNDWFYTVYLCPQTEDCSEGLKSHKGFSETK